MVVRSEAWVVVVRRRLRYVGKEVVASIGVVAV